MRWYGKVFGAIAVGLLMRGHPAGFILGAIIGHAFDAGWFSSKPKRQGPPPEEDYRILGVDEQADEAEIDRAYRKLMAQYHPDRMSGAAPEIRELAEKRSREINAAYDRIRTRRKSNS